MKPDVHVATHSSPRPFLVRPLPTARKGSTLSHAQRHLERCARASELLALPGLCRWYEIGSTALKLWRLEQRYRK